MGTSLAILFLRLCASTLGGMGLIPGGGTKIYNQSCGGGGQSQVNSANF